MNEQRPRPPRRHAARRELQLAETPHADFGERETCRDAALRAASGIDQSFTPSAALHSDLVLGLCSDENFDQRLSACIHTEWQFRGHWMPGSKSA